MNAARIALLVAVVLCGSSAAFFYTYEASITLGLADVDDTTYIAAFQALNDNVRNPAIATVFFGSIPAIALALALNWSEGDTRRWLIAAGLACYVALIVITAAGNVPLNDDLAEYTATMTATKAADARAGFEDDWNRLNLIRTIAAVASFVLLTSAAILPDVRDTSSRSHGPADAATTTTVGR